MIVVMGREPSVLVGLADRLHSRDLAARVLAGGENLFDVAWDHGASVVVAVDALPRVGNGGARSAPIDWDELLRVARGPKRPRIVWCTAHPESEPGARLRKSGVGYVTVRAGTLVRAADLSVGDVRGRTIRIARDIAVPDAGLTPLGELLDALAEATTTAKLGHVFDVRHTGPDAWSEVIAQLGGRPKVTARPLARMLSWVGAPALLELPAVPSVEPGAPISSVDGNSVAHSHKEVIDESASTS